jgi:hypothetical protein
LLFLPFLALVEKKRGPKHAGWMQSGCITQVGSMQAGCTQYAEFFDSELVFDDFTRVGQTAHLRERSKSESIICPSSLTKTFSGLRSL